MGNEIPPGETTNERAPKGDRSFEAIRARMDMSLRDAMMTQRAVRRVLPDDVDDDIVQSSHYGSIYPSVQNLLLAARSMGLGASLITLPLWNQFKARRILGLPFKAQPVCIVPLGRPQGRYGPTTRRPVGDVVHLDRYGQRRLRDG